MDRVTIKAITNEYECQTPHTHGSKIKFLYI